MREIRGDGFYNNPLAPYIGKDMECLECYLPDCVPTSRHCLLPSERNRHAARRAASLRYHHKQRMKRGVE